MKELKIEKHKWQPNFKDEAWITKEDGGVTFTVTLKQDNDIHIECDWDYGYGGRGVETMNIPVDVLKQLIKELGM